MGRSFGSMRESDVFELTALYQLGMS